MSATCSTLESRCSSLARPNEACCLACGFLACCTAWLYYILCGARVCTCPSCVMCAG